MAKVGVVWMRLLVREAPPAGLNTRYVAYSAGGAGGHLKMGQTDGKCVGGIWRGVFGEAKERADHEGDLLFLCAAAPDDALFHTTRRVFVDGQAMLRRGEHSRTAGGAHDDRGAHALYVNDGLERGAVGLMASDEVAHFFVDRDEAAARQQIGAIFDRAVFKRYRFRTAFFQNGITGVAQRWVDRKDAAQRSSGHLEAERRHVLHGDDTDGDEREGEGGIDQPQCKTGALEFDDHRVLLRELGILPLDDAAKNCIVLL